VRDHISHSAIREAMGRDGVADALPSWILEDPGSDVAWGTTPIAPVRV
jgi:hypothetical protein